MKKIIFLDIDGVLNCEESMRRGVRGQGVEMIDPYRTIVLDRIIQATGAEVVLSSSWRHSDKSYAEINEKVVKLIDRTGNCCAGIRGVEIYSWINKNIDYTEKNDRNKFRYAIIDDDSDMLLWQKDHFFQTTFMGDGGLTEEIAEKVIKHLNT